MLVQIVGTTSRVRVIRALFRLGQASGREVSREGGLPPSCAKAALDELVDLGLVSRSRQRRRHVFALNPAHPFYGPLLRLFEEENAVVHRVADAVQAVCADGPFRGFQLVRIGVDSVRGTVSVHVTPKPGDMQGALRERVVAALRSRHGLGLDVVVADGRHMGHRIVWPEQAPAGPTSES